MTPAQRTLDLTVPLDLERTLGPVVQGVGGAPSMRRIDRGLAWALRTPEGDVELQLSVDSAARQLSVTAWGEGSDWALDNLPVLVGLEDDAESFTPKHPLLRKLSVKLAGVRLPRVPHITEVLVRIVLSQLVTHVEARRADLALCRRFGRAAPGPHELRLAPRGLELGRLPLEELLEAGVLTKQAKTIQFLGRRSEKIDQIASMTAVDRDARLAALRGIGPWSASSLRLHALGDADAVVVGDAHVHDDVVWALAGEERGDDDRMLELLEPFAGHRGRVISWITLAGLHAPRRGPKRTPRATRQSFKPRAF